MTMHKTWMKRILQGAVLVAVAASVPVAGAAQPGIQVNNVAAGAAAVSRSGAVTTVRTATDRTIINYQRLNVGTGETLNFVQPSASSRVLNRIQGNTPTQIDGTLLSNGQVYLLNPSGVMFGNGAVVNVGGLFAAAGHMSDADFMAGNNLFSNNQGLVRNDGVIQANQVHLLGLNVENFGQIIATPSSTGGGVVTMTAGKDVYIGETSSPAGKPTVMVKISSEGSAGANSTGVRNAGTVDAGAGSLHMGAGDVYAAGLYNSGTLKGRNIALNSGANTNISTGKIDASNAGGKGGSVALLGKKVGVFEGTVDASGTAGGGEILVGGDVHGGGGVPVSQAAVVSDAATIRADGTAAGANGGKVIVFSSENTRVGGTLSTLNGAGGIGGFIETSSLGSLLVTHAPLIGNGGTWLLDPLDVTINGGPSTGTVNAVASNDTTFTADTDPVVIDQADINTALGTGNVTITTPGGVTWSAGAPMSYVLGGATRTLTINAGDVISLNSSITTAGADTLNINLTTSGDVVINAAINTNGGTFHSSGSAFATLGAGSVATDGGQFTLSYSGLVAINGPISAGAGNMSITSGRITQGATFTANNLDITATDAVDLSFANPVNRLAVNETGAGKGVTFASTGALTIGNAGSLSGVTLNGGDLVVLVPAILSVSSPIVTHNGLQRYLVSDINITAAMDAGTGVLLFESSTGAETFGLGQTVGRTITIDQTEIALLASNVQIGGPLQTGDLESKAAVFPHSVTLTTTGNLVLDDSAGAALGGNVITANVGSISAAQATNGVPELIGTNLGTAISLTTTAGIGNNSNRVEIVAPVGKVSISAGANVYLGGVIGLTFSSVSVPGNDLDVLVSGDINATGAIAANNITLTAAGGIGTNGAVAVNATGTVQLTTTVSGGDIHITPVATNTPTLVIATDLTTSQTITIDRAGDLGIGSNIVVGANDALVLRAGAGGAPSSLAFAPGVVLSADSITLWSGTGGGATSAVDFTNAPTIVNGGGSPTSFMLRQDASIADAPDAGSVLNYTLRSDGGAVTVNSTGHLANTNATLAGTGGVSIVGGLNVVSLDVSGNAALNGDVAAVTHVVFNNDLVLKANTALSGVDLTVSGVVRSENSNAWTLATTFTGVSTFTGGFATLLVEQLGGLTINSTALGTVHMGNGSTQVLHVTEKETVNPTADGRILIGEDLFLFSNVQVLAGTTSFVLPPNAGDVTFAGTIQAIGAHFTLFVNGSGVISFQKDIGGNGNPLGGVTTLGVGLPSDLTVLGSGSPFTITVGSPIVFGTPVELHSNTTLIAPGVSGNVTFTGAVSSEAGKFWTLTVNAGGTTAFQGDVGATLNGQLGFLKTDSAGQLTLGNGAGPIAIKTLENTGVRPISTGEVSFGESTVTLQDNVTITAGHTNAVATPVDDVTFNILSSNDTFGISVISPGKTWLKGGVNVNPGGRLGFITTDGPGTTLIGNGGALIIRTTAGQTYGDPVTLTGPTNFEGTALAFLGTPVSLDAGAFQLTLMTNALTFASGTDRVQGTGNLIIRPFSQPEEIVVGSAGILPGALYLTQMTLRALKDGFANIVIGGPQQTATITIQSDDPASPVVFNDPVLFEALGNTIVVNSPNPLIIPALYGNGNASIVLQSDILLLSGSIMTRGNGLAVTSRILLGNVPFAYLKSYGDVGTNILSTGAVGGNISIGSVDDDSQSSQFLLDAQGSVTKGFIGVDSVGNSRFTGGFFAFGQNLNLKGNIKTAGPVSIQTNTLTLNGTGASVNAILIDTDPSSGNDAGALTIVGPINGDAGGPVALTINTSAAAGHLGANISLQTVGGVTPLASLDLFTSTGAVSVQAVTTTGHINSTGFGFPFSSFTSTGALTSTGAADIRIQHSGLVTIGGAVTANNVVSRGDIMIAGPTIDIHAGAPIDGGIVALSLDASTDPAAFPDPFVKVGSPITASQSFSAVGNLQFDKGRFQSDALIRVTGIAESSNLTLDFGAGVVLNAPLNSGDGFSDVSITGSSVTQNSGIILGRALALASHDAFPDPFTLTALNQVDRLSITNVAAVSFKNSKALNLTGAVSLFGAMSIEVVSNPLSITGPVSGDAITFTASDTTTSGLAPLNATTLTVHGPFTLGANANTNGGMTFDGTVFLSNASLIVGADISAPALTGSGNVLAANINAGVVDLTGTLLAGNSINVTTTTRVTGNISATADHVHIANATVTGNIAAGTDLAVTGQLSMTGNVNAATVDVTGPASITGDLTASGAATFHDTLSITNITATAITVTGDATFHGLAKSTTGDITIQGNLGGAGTISAAAALLVGGGSAFSGNMASGTSFTITGPVNIQNATLTSGGDMTFNTTATLDVTATAAGALTIGGAAHLTGSYTGGSVSIPSGITMTNNLAIVASGSKGMTLGPITGPFNLTLGTNDKSSILAVGAIGTGVDNRVLDVKFLSANVVNLNGDIYARSVAFNDNVDNATRLDPPNYATITKGDSLTIDVQKTFTMELYQKLSVYRQTAGNAADLSIVSHILENEVPSDRNVITIGDLNALGHVTVNANGLANRINILYRAPQKQLLSNGNLSGTDLGTDIVSGFHGVGAINFSGLIHVENGDVSHRIAFSSFNASTDVKSDPLTRLYLAGNNIAILPLNLGSDEIAPGEFLLIAPPHTVLDIVARGTPGTSPIATIGAIVPRDVQTLQPERAQAISGALKDALIGMGVNARDLRNDEIIDYLIGRALYNDVPHVLNPGPLDRLIAANRLPYAPVQPAADAYRLLFLKPELNAQGDPIVENGKPKMIPQEKIISTAIYDAWLQFQKDMADKLVPAGFRAYLESHQKDDDKQYALALDYLDRVRDLLIQIKALGLTSAEYEGSRKVILAKVRPLDISEEDFAAAIDGPTTRAGGNTAVK